MPVPYSRESIAALRHAERTRTPAEEIQRHLGWDGDMLARICRKHGIEIFGTAVNASPLEPLPPVAADPIEVVRTISKLTPLQTQIFRIFQRHAGQLIKGTHIADLLGKEGVRSLGITIASLGRHLERMHLGYRIESQKGPCGGYRLVIDKGAS